MPKDESLEVIATYRRRAAQDEGHAIEDALREERNAALAKLRQIAVMLGCTVDEIVPTLASMGAANEGTGSDEVSGNVKI